MKIWQLERLLDKLRVKREKFVIGVQDDTMIVSLFRKDNKIVTRFRDDRGIGEIFYNEDEEEKAVEDFLINLSTGL